MKQQTQNKIEWRNIRLGDFYNVKKGKSITKKTIADGGIPVIAGGQQPAYYHNTANRTGETITVSGSGAYAGFVAYFTIPIFASDCSTIQSKEKNVFIKYTYYLLKGNQKKIYQLQKGIAQPHIYPKDLEELKIPLPFSNNSPDLAEQQRIVSILEKAENQKEKSKKVLDLLDEYLKSVFNEMFVEEGFEEVELGITAPNKGDFVDGPFGSDLKVSHQTDDGVRLIQINNIGVGEWRDNIKRYTSEERYSKLIRHSAKNGEIVIAKMGEPLGRACFVPDNLRKSLVVADCMRLRVTNKQFDKKYVLFFLNTPYSKKQIENMSRGSTRIRINLSMIKSLKIPLPPLPLQQKFSKIVEQVEKMKEQIKKTKSNAEELFNSLMSKAFRGEL